LWGRGGEGRVRWVRGIGGVLRGLMQRDIFILVPEGYAFQIFTIDRCLYFQVHITRIITCISRVYIHFSFHKPHNDSPISNAAKQMESPVAVSPPYFLLVNKLSMKEVIGFCLTSLALASQKETLLIHAISCREILSEQL
jgi:hypothetical protein